MYEMRQVTARVLSRTEVMPGTHLLWLHAPEIANAAQPGQFVTLRCGEDTMLRRPFSIHGIQSDKVCILFAVVGRGTRWLSLKSEGDELDVLGPLGNGFQINEASRRLLLVAGGIGVAPLTFLAQQAIAEGRSVKLLSGAATAQCLYPHANVPDLMQVTQDGSDGEKGMVTDFIPSLAGWADQVFACGPIPMYRTMARMSRDLDDTPIQIALEQVMACGVGACRGCAVPTTRGMRMVCQDGPVFDLGEILWDEVREPACPGATG